KVITGEMELMLSLTSDQLLILINGITTELEKVTFIHAITIRMVSTISMTLMTTTMAFTTTMIIKNHTGVFMAKRLTKAEAGLLAWLLIIGLIISAISVTVETIGPIALGS